MLGSRGPGRLAFVEVPGRVRRLRDGPRMLASDERERFSLDIRNSNPVLLTVVSLKTKIS
jgi:hypothetical protein